MTLTLGHNATARCGKRIDTYSLLLIAGTKKIELSVDILGYVPHTDEGKKTEPGEPKYWINP